MRKEEYHHELAGKQRKVVMVRELTVAILYGIISVSITFFNKAILSLFKFKYSALLTLGQMVFSLIFLSLLKHFNIIYFADFSISAAKKTIPLAACFTLMVVTGLSSLALISVPVFTALRRISTLLVIVGDLYFFGKGTETNETQSVIFMVIGALLAVAGDMDHSVYGYALLIFNCVITATYMIEVSRKSKDTGLTTFGIMFYCNLLSMPIVVILFYLFEYEDMAEYIYLTDYSFLFCFFAACIQAFILNYLTYLCCAMNSPLTTTATSVFKAFLSTVLGLFVFADVQITFLLLLGLFISFIGSIWYNYVKYSQFLSKSRMKVKNSVKSYVLSVDCRHR